MKLTYDGKVCEIRETCMGPIVSELRFQIGDETASIRVPKQLQFQEPVRITIETLNDMPLGKVLADKLEEHRA